MQQENQSNIFTNINIDHEARQYIRTMATWAMIAVVVAVIGYVLSIVELVSPRQMQSIRSEGFNSFFLEMRGTNVASSVVMIIIGLVVNYFLYRFSVLARRGVDGMHQQSLNSGFANLKFYFMIASILSIIVCVIICFVVFFLIGR